MADPLILAFDTASTHCTVALVEGSGVRAALHKEMTRGQAEELFPLMQQVLHDAGTDFGALDAIAVGTGPGNFTGIRISVAAARGLAMSLDVPAIGVTTLEAVAEGVSGPCIACVDARRSMAYLQGFSGAAPSAPELIDLAVLPAQLATGNIACVGPPAEHVAALLGGEVVASPYPLAVAMGRIAARRLSEGREIAPPAPVYLRPADAAPARDIAPTILS